MQIRIRLPHFGLLAACLPLLLLSLTLRAQAPQAPPAPLTGPGFIVTYAEAPAAKSATLSADLKAYAREIERGSAKPRVTVLSELGRPNRMVVIEQWQDLSSAAFAQAETLLSAKAQPDVQAPMDRRVNHPLTPVSAPAAQAPSKAFPATAFYVLMHVDIRGNAGDAPKILQAQRDAVLAAPGALDDEVTVQDQRSNHFSIFEVWSSRAAYEAYTATGPPEDYRRSLATLIGAPYDDRFYARVGD
jgi:quinol monooxygenase YgiN